MRELKTQVAIIGGGPSGLLLSQLLHLNGVDSIVIERQTRDHVLTRIRAGVLESGTVRLLRKAEAAHNLDLHGDVHRGIDISFNGNICHVPFEKLTNGQTVTVYGQTEVTRDLYEARDKLGGIVLHSVSDVELHGIDSDKPSVSFYQDEKQSTIECDFIIGCDGYRGVSRKNIPESEKKEHEKVYPFGWLGVLSETPPVSKEVMYAYHEKGFALCSMRHSNLSRYYIQVPIGENIEDWSDDRFWKELKSRLPEKISNKLITGPSIEKSIAPLRSFVCEPMSFGKLFLVGDAAHIVPPTGAKGLNLAVSDVHYIFTALNEYYESGSTKGLSDYSKTALDRVWKTERFSLSLTNFLHHFPQEGGFNERIRQAEFDYLCTSEAFRTSFSEGYVGLPY